MNENYSRLGSMDATMAAAAQRNAQLPEVKPIGHLEEILKRIQVQSDRAAKIAGHLAAHADRLHGGSIKAGSAKESTPSSSGIIGNIMDALERLGCNIDDLQQEADRNCNLA